MRLKSISILIFIVSLIASTLFAQEENEMERIKSVINELEQKYAPDSRTAIFKISAEQENDNYILKGETNFTSAKEELLRKLNNFNTIDQIKILPDSDLGEDIYGIINLSVANLRTKPENQAEMASQALLGTPIKVLKKKKG
ncbi:MAG: glycoside hydrolase, partial [Ignavibacteriaceae bacterium]